MDARKVGGTGQAAPSGVADVMAVAADKGIADPTKAKERASLMAEPFRFIFAFVHPYHGEADTLLGNIALKGLPRYNLAFIRRGCPL